MQAPDVAVDPVTIVTGSRLRVDDTVATARARVDAGGARRNSVASSGPVLAVTVPVVPSGCGSSVAVVVEEVVGAEDVPVGLAVVVELLPSGAAAESSGAGQAERSESARIGAVDVCMLGFRGSWGR